MKRLSTAVYMVLTATLAPALADTPNILVVVLDDVGVDQFSAYGEAGACSGNGNQCASDADCPGVQTCITDYPTTPTINEIAQQGILFRNAYAAPTCKTARAAGMTGRYPQRTGVLSNAADFPPDERTIAEALKDPSIVPTEYATAAFGKWGLGNDVSPLDQGFDHYAGSLGSGIGNYFSWNRTVDTTTSPCSPGSQACPDESYVTTVNANDAIAWIGNRTEPWFVWFAFNAPHSPWQVPPHDLVTPETLARLPDDGMGNPAPEGTSCDGFDRECYLAMLEAADHELARLLDVVPEDTWVILLGDNGTPNQITAAPFEMTQAKGSVFEPGINVPLVVRTPEPTLAGSESEAFVHIVDLFSTVIEIAGGTPPRDRLLDSLSLLPVIHDPSVSMRPVDFGEGAPGKVARNGRYKLMRSGTGDAFYDLQQDPFEHSPLNPGSLNDNQQAILSALGATVDATAAPSGRVPDGKVIAAPPLRIARGLNGQLELSWSDACGSSDIDYAVYEGHLDDFDSHEPALCSTGGLPSAMIPPAGDSTYYLVVPTNGLTDGSHGTSSNGVPRSPGVGPCLAPSHAGCD
jgi:arylsulfatase A-like enzyme